MRDRRSISSLALFEYNQVTSNLYGILSDFSGLVHKITSSSMSVFVGKSGYGKTTHANYLHENAPNTHLITARPSTSPSNLAKAISVHVGFETPPLNITNHERVDHILSQLPSSHTTIVIDDAHLLPIETLALCSLLANSVSNKTFHFALFGLPTLKEKFDSFDFPSETTYTIEAMTKDDIQNWITEALSYSGCESYLPLISEPFFNSLFTQTQGIPRQVRRLAEPMLKTELMRIYNEQQSAPSSKKNVGFGAFFSAASLAVLGMLYNAPVIAKISQEQIHYALSSPAAESVPERKVNVIALIETRIERDEQFVLNSHHEFEQIKATQNLSEVVTWLTHTRDIDRVRVVRAIRGGKAYYLLLKEPGETLDSFGSESWTRKYENLKNDINAFLRIQSNTSQQA